jgi:hypothetical protein
VLERQKSQSLRRPPSFKRWAAAARRFFCAST